MSAVLDANVALSGAVDEEADPRAEAARSILPPLHHRFGLAAPALLVWEVGQIVHREHSASFGDDASERAEVVGDILAEIALDPPTPESTVRTSLLAEKLGLTFYDAAYLELAARDGTSLLVTEDEALRHAARALLGEGRVWAAARLAEAIERNAF